MYIWTDARGKNLDWNSNTNWDSEDNNAAARHCVMAESLSASRSKAVVKLSEPEETAVR